MRRLPQLFAALLVLPLLGSDSPKGYHDATHVCEIEGTWRLLGYKVNGRTLRIPLLTVTFRGGEATFRYVDGRTETGRCHLDPTRTPPHLDYFPTDGGVKEAVLCIYRVEGGMLSLARRGGPNVPRPKRFEDEEVSVFTFERAR
jgi:uncharacterized protein (TIGR03067 family)